jgi:hypothetical protein
LDRWGKSEQPSRIKVIPEKKLKKAFFVQELAKKLLTPFWLM